MQVAPGRQEAAKMSPCLQAAAAGTEAEEGDHASDLSMDQQPQFRVKELHSVEAHVLHAWGMPVSPHLAVEQEGKLTQPTAALTARMIAWFAARCCACVQAGA